MESRSSRKTGTEPGANFRPSRLQACSFASRRGFSLIEVLVVMSIIGVMAAATIPAFQQLVIGSNFTVSGELLRDNLTLARQTALVRNHSVEVRFYQFQGNGATTSDYQAFQLFLQKDDGTYDALTKVLYFPKSIILNTNAQFSSLFDSNTTNTTIGQGVNTGVKLPEVGTTYQYLSFKFKPGGGTSLAQVPPCFVTLVAKNAAPVNGSLPANFVTVQIDPVVGKVAVLRP